MAQLGVDRPNDERNLPVVTIDVPKKSIDALDGLEPGSTVRVVLEGNVVEVSKREPSVSSPGFSGMLKIEVRKLAARKVDNAFSELMEDD